MENIINREILDRDIAEKGKEQKDVLEKANTMTTRQEAIDVNEHNKDLKKSIDVLRIKAEELGGYQTEVIKRIDSIEADNKRVMEIIGEFVKNMNQTPEINTDTNNINEKKEVNNDNTEAGIIKNISNENITEKEEIDFSVWYTQNESMLLDAANKLIEDKSIYNSGAEPIKKLAELLSMLPARENWNGANADPVLIKIRMIKDNKPEYYGFIVDAANKIRENKKEDFVKMSDFLKNTLNLDIFNSNKAEIFDAVKEAENNGLLRNGSEYHGNMINAETFTDKMMEVKGLMEKEGEETKAKNMFRFAVKAYFKKFDDTYADRVDNNENVSDNPYDQFRDAMIKGGHMEK